RIERFPLHALADAEQRLDLQTEDLQDLAALDELLEIVHHQRPGGHLGRGVEEELAQSAHLLAPQIHAPPDIVVRGERLLDHAAQSLRLHRLDQINTGVRAVAGFERRYFSTSNPLSSCRLMSIRATSGICSPIASTARSTVGAH